MAQQDEKEYILGTDREELHRLGLQHQVWASEARKGWDLAEFGAGQTILDLGCGPGFCTVDLGYVVGSQGKVIGVDKSKHFLQFLEKLNNSHEIELELHHADFIDLELEANSIDAVYCRWALAWVKDPESILEKLYDALVPGGAMVIQEYYDWSTFQSEPKLPNLQNGIDSIYKSFKEQDGDIDVGRYLPSYFYNLGMEVISTRPMSKITTPDQLTWQWPKTFLNIFMPKLVDMGYLTGKQVELALDELYQLEELEGATIFCPQMVEVIAIKP